MGEINVAAPRAIRDLSCDESFRSAAGKILWARFDEMMSFRDVAVAGEDIEGVHDMRVASRRLRAAFEIFRDVFPKRYFRPLLRELKAVADALGQVRDLDVMLDNLQKDREGRPESQQIVLQDIVEEMQAQRSGARARLMETLARLEDGEFPRRFLTIVARESG